MGDGREKVTGCGASATAVARSPTGSERKAGTARGGEGTDTSTT